MSVKTEKTLLILKIIFIYKIKAQLMKPDVLEKCSNHP